ncbi:MAG: hypothetical protein ACLSCQ_03295 [Evtepia gabavorous]
MALTVRQTYLTQNDCYRSGGALTPQGLMLHSVGCAQPDAMAFVQSWNQPGVKACVHGFIDANTGAVYQTLPGPAAAGTAAGPPTTPTSAWKCVNPPPFAIPAGQTS